MHMRSGLFVPIFDVLADLALVGRLSAEAEEAGWDGVFVYDHVRWREPVLEVADAWITLATIAAATQAIRLGPMVTPLAGRRPVKVARETVTLDRLSDGRLTLGVGLGSDRFGNEFSITGEELDDRRRAGMLDDALEILTAAWSGEPVHHRGQHFMVDGMRFLPRPVQRPGIPVWVGGYPGKRNPLRRAARFRVLPGRPRAPRTGCGDRRRAHDASSADRAGPRGALRRRRGASAGHQPSAVHVGRCYEVDGEFPLDGLSVDRVRGVVRDGSAPSP
jgi:alkanesulfonate monooxygenase SsuD/methylene tetrahydromethanopterin reductase-like flavin-dependent oxidoreductase (luciferase family)